MAGQAMGQHSAQRCPTLHVLPREEEHIISCVSGALHSVLDGETESTDGKITCPRSHSWDSLPGLSGSIDLWPRLHGCPETQKIFYSQFVPTVHSLSTYTGPY